MKILEIHEKAMEYSQKAKISLNDGDLASATTLYKQAADLEVKVVDYYLSKEGSKRSKSIFVRSAAFLCLKAGEYDRAYPLILEGLRISDEFPSIKEELLEAMEVYIGNRRQLQTGDTKTGINYESLLAKNSIEYTISSANPTFGTKIPVSDAYDFLKNYDSSILAYAKAEYRHEGIPGKLTTSQLKSEIVPLITAVSNGSLKVSIAMDFLKRGQSDDFTHFKEILGKKFHKDILTPDYTEERIESYIKRYEPEERKGIFEPIFKIRSSRSNYDVSYKRFEHINKIRLNPIKDIKKTKLVSYQKEEVVIKEIETLLVGVDSTGRRSNKNILGSLGKVTSYSNSLEKDFIDMPKSGQINLNEPLLINFNWTADDNFTVWNETLGFEAHGALLPDAINVLSLKIEEDIISLNNISYNKFNTDQRNRMKFYRKLINNITVIK